LACTPCRWPTQRAAPTFRQRGTRSASGRKSPHQPTARRRHPLRPRSLHGSALLVPHLCCCPTSVLLALSERHQPHRPPTLARRSARHRRARLRRLPRQCRPSRCSIPKRALLPTHLRLEHASFL
jgi:hypothetical protein